MATYRLLFLGALALVACDDGPQRFDFRDGGIEIIFGFQSRSAPGTYVTPDAAAVRRALAAAGERRSEVIETPWTPRGGQRLPAVRIHVALRDWPTAAAREAALAALRARFADDLARATWSGQRLFLRTRRALDKDEVRALLDGAGVDVVDYLARSNDDLPDEHEAVITAAGPDLVLERALEAQLPDLDAVPLYVSMVGPQRRR